MGSYRSFGMFGLILLLFGLLGGFISSGWNTIYVLVHLIGGTSLVVLYLFTHIETLRESVSGRRTQYATNTIVYTVLTLVVVAIINYWGAQNPWRFDATEGGMFSAAPQTRQLLEGLDRDIEVLAFFQEGQEAGAQRLLDIYTPLSDRFTYRIVDPDKRPEIAQEHEVTQYGTLVLTSGDDSTRLTTLSEEELTNALIRFTAADTKRIYFTTGHGEPDIEAAQTATGLGQFKAALENEGAEVQTLLLASIPDVPADANLLVIANPQRPFLENELEVLGRHIDRGGRALFLLEPRAADDLVALLAERGIDVGNDVIIDQTVRLFAGPTLGVEPIVSDYDSFHPITSNLAQQTIYTLVRSVRKAEETPTGITVTEIARTSPSSWAETDVERLFTDNEAGLDGDDVAGPIPIAAAATLSGTALSYTEPAIETAPSATFPGSDEEDTGEETEAGEETEEGADTEAEATDEGGDEETEEQSAGALPPAGLEGRIVVFGDAEWVDNRKLSMFYNEDLALSAVGWLTGGDEESIAIRPRSRRASRVILTQTQGVAVFYLTVLLLPELVLLSGLVVWWRRRR